MSKNIRKNCCNRRKSRIDKNLILPLLLILLGIVFIVWWMPLWIWFVFIGIILIIMGIKNV